eukprot:TRINITY_DN39603_c0_g1_i2.p1 TRINITY_DN39603_c0_g1~~TRINITY_DN39603_c0_g1_i2.p1  ORF type:complete len:237 (-),score=42.44 TRINITY_DN39603_c0_g1_i2:257-871(-)
MPMEGGEQKELAHEPFPEGGRCFDIGVPFLCVVELHATHTESSRACIRLRLGEGASELVMPLDEECEGAVYLWPMSKAGAAEFFDVNYTDLSLELPQQDDDISQGQGVVQRPKLLGRGTPAEGAISEELAAQSAALEHDVEADARTADSGNISTEPPSGSHASGSRRPSTRSVGSQQDSASGCSSGRDREHSWFSSSGGSCAHQ